MYTKILSSMLILVSIFCHAQTLVSNFSPNNVTGGIVYSHVNGDYLYANTTAGNYFLKIIDVSNPAAPNEVASISGNSQDGFCSQVVGNYLFWTNMGNGVQIYDISNPVNPTFVNSIDTQANAGGHYQSLAYGLHVDGNYLYVANFKEGSNFQVYDISDINNIIFKDGIHIGDEAKYVDVVGNYAFVANRFNGLKIIDVSDKTNISIAATYDPGQVIGVDVEGDYAYLTTGTGLEIINISTPTSPSLEGSFNTSGSAHTVTYDSNTEMAYVADQSNGALIIDVSTPSSPSLYGTYDSSGTTQHISVGSGNAYLSDWNDIVLISAPLPDYGQVYVYQTSDYASSTALGSVYLAVMGAAEVSNDTPPAVTSYTTSTVSPYYKFKTGELGNASVDIGASGAMTLMASGSGSDLDDVLDGLNPINHNGTGQIIVAFPKGSDMTVPTSIQEEFNGVTGGAVPYSNSDGYGFGLESGVIHSITLDSPHLGYSEWYIFGRKSFTAIGSKIKFRLVDASGAAPSPSYSDIPRISITEIMYNSSGTDDEWIEIYNATGDLNSPEDVDISGWTVGIPDGSDEYSGEIFTFPSSTTIAAGEYLTIALGSNGDGVFNNDNPFTPDFNNLSGSPSNLDVKDTNDTDNLGDDSGSIVLRPNDFDTGSIVYYDDITRPGTDGTGYTYENTYPPNNQVSTSDTGTWQSSFIPGGSPKIKSAEIWDSSLGSSDNLIILNNENIFVAAQDVNINDVTVNAGGSLTILKNSSSSLTINNNFINNGTVILNSDSDEFSSIIVGGSSTGDIVYNRYVNTVGDGEWDLIGSPVDGLSISDFVTTNSSVLATNGSSYAIGYHDNTDDSWTNYTTATVGGAGNFDISRGYQMATSSGATMAFTGSIATTDQTQSIVNNNDNGGRRWNLVANPYPSYLNANTNAHASNNFLSVNASVIDSNFLSIYGWNADGSGYTIYNNTSSATYIAPGQAFFVAAASSTAADLSFTEAMQTTTGGDDFISLGLENTSSEFSLYLHEGQDKVAATRFYFDYGLGLGLDPGYDAGAYNPSMALSSRLAEDDQGINMGINAMNIDSFEQTIIPLVINRAAGIAFRISMEDSTIPQGVEVYLEDTQTQVLTNLRNQDFILTPQSDVSGMGRFYLKMSGNSLEVGDIEESYISIYKPSDRDCIVMEGLSNVQSGHVKLYNIMGQEVITQGIKPNESTQNILTSGLESGIYIIKLNADNLILTKKLIIK